MKKLDLTPLEHIVIAAVIMGLIGFFTGNWAAGACLGTGIFLGREHSQAEYRWMTLYKVNRTGKEAIGAFSPKVWNMASLLDMMAPILACMLFTLIAYRYAV